MHKIISKKKLAPNIFQMELEAPLIAPKVKAGQFLIIRVHEDGERIPLTFMNWSPEKGTITIAFMVVGKTTDHLAGLEVGDSIPDIAGPLGNPTHAKKYGHVVCVAGGVGSAEVLPTARAFKEAGNKVTVIEGARNADFLLFEEELVKIADSFLIATDDGSKGHHGFNLDLLKGLIESGEKIDLIFTVGPVPMMRAVSQVTQAAGISTLASLNPLMIDGSGMCGGCRVEIGGETKFGCVDGPEFDAHLVNWDLLVARQRTYIDEEKQSWERFKAHNCNLLQAADK